MTTPTVTDAVCAGGAASGASEAEPRGPIAVAARIERAAQLFECVLVAAANGRLGNSIAARDGGERLAVEVMTQQRAAIRLVEREHELDQHAKRLRARDCIGRRARCRRDLRHRVLASHAPLRTAMRHPARVAQHAREPWPRRQVRIRRRPQRGDVRLLHGILGRCTIYQLAREIAQPVGMCQQGGKVVGGHHHGLCRPRHVRCRNRASTENAKARARFGCVDCTCGGASGVLGQVGSALCAEQE